MRRDAPQQYKEQQIAGCLASFEVTSTKAPLRVRHFASFKSVSGWGSVAGHSGLARPKRLRVCPKREIKAPTEHLWWNTKGCLDLGVG